MNAILIVKLTSMGDILQHLPIVADIKRQYPDAEIDWAADAAFADMPKLCASLRQVHGIPLRAMKKSSQRRDLMQQLLTVRQRLRETKYDLVIDTQGMIKSALVARMARADHYLGYHPQHCAERAAAWFYTRHGKVPFDLHATQKARALVASVLHPESPSQAIEETLLQTPIFDVRAPKNHSLPWLNIEQSGKVVTLLMHTSQAEKRWPTSHWLSLAGELTAAGARIVLIGGSDSERAQNREFAAHFTGVLVAPALTLADCAAVLEASDLIIGVDTGLTHLASALNRPTIALFTVTRPSRYAFQWLPNLHTLLADSDVLEVPMVLESALPWIA